MLKVLNNLKENRRYLEEAAKRTWSFFEDYIKNALDIPLLESTRDINERYNNHIFILNEKYEKFKNDLITKILPEIEYNINNWPNPLKNFPIFFVAESVGGIKDTLYCHSSNMEFDDNNDFIVSGIVFTNINSNGRLKSFNPKNWCIRKMSEYEFNKIFLPNILDDNKFNDVREMNDYSKYLKLKFEIFKEKYE